MNYKQLKKLEVNNSSYILSLNSETRRVYLRVERIHHTTSGINFVEFIATSDLLEQKRRSKKSIERGEAYFKENESRLMQDVMNSIERWEARNLGGEL